MYHFIESEMRKAGLFDASKPQGAGWPDMDDHLLEQLRNHIETFVFKRIYKFTSSLGPQLIDLPSHDGLDDDDDEPNVSASGSLAAPNPNPRKQTRPGGGVTPPPAPPVALVGKSSVSDLTMKLATLRFATLEQLGLFACKDVSATEKIILDRHCSRFMSYHEWTLAAKGFARALELDTPSAILNQLVHVVRITTSALEAYLRRRIRAMRCLKQLLEFEESNALYLPFYCGVCGSRHGLSPATDLTPSKTRRKLRDCRGRDGDLAVRTCLDGAIVRSKVRERLGESGEGDGDPPVDEELEEENIQISADDLLPAIAWVIIRSNPPSIDTALWLCAEFRHPDLLHGEQAFCLSQVSSAVEFCRAATAASLDLDEDLFSALTACYQVTLQLLIACKRDDVRGVQNCIRGGADVNGLTPDQKDSPLTACVRFGSTASLETLLEHPEIDVNRLVSPFHGQNQMASALLLAVIGNKFRFVLTLLRYGADRYLSDGNGVNSQEMAIGICAKQRLAALSPREHQRQDAIAELLQYDPDTSKLDQLVGAGNSNGVVSLLLQGVSASECEGNMSALMHAISSLNIEIVRSILCLSSKDIVNMRSSDRVANSPLLHLAKLFLKECSMQVADAASIHRLHKMCIICAMLLRAGADRHVVDDAGTSAAQLAHLALQSSYFSLESPLDMATSGVGESSGRVIMSESSSEATFPATHEVAYLFDFLPPLPLNDCLLRCRRRFSKLLDCNPETHTVYAMSEINDLDGVWSLLAQGADVNLTCPDRGFNAVIGSVFNRNHDMLEILIHSTDLSNETNFGLTHILSMPVLDPTERDDDALYNFIDIRDAPGVQRVDLNKPGREGMTALHYAAQVGDAVIVGRLLQAGADRMALNDNEHTALDVGTRKGHMDACNVLRYDPAKVPIALAAKNNDWLVLSALLRQGVSINTRRPPPRISGAPVSTPSSPRESPETYTPLIAAIAHKQSEMIQNILRLPGVELDVQNQLGMCALSYASLSGDEALVLQLLSLGADRYIRDDTGKYPADLATDAGFEALACILRNDPNHECVHQVIRRGDFASTVALFKQGVDPNQQLFHSDGRPELKQTVSPIDGITPLMVAAIYNQVKIVNLLIKAPDMKINVKDASYGWTALCHAAFKGNEDVVLALLKAGASRGSTDCNGNTATDIALQAGQLTCAALLQADPLKVFIHDVCREGRVLLVQALLKQGCPPTFRDERPETLRQTPLMAACSGGQYDVVKVLLGCPGVIAAVDDRDDLGQTALMRAARVAALEVTAILLSAGANRALKDNAGLSARDHALKHSYSNMFQFMSQQLVH